MRWKEINNPEINRIYLVLLKKLAQLNKANNKEVPKLRNFGTSLFLLLAILFVVLLFTAILCH